MKLVVVATLALAGIGVALAEKSKESADEAAIRKLDVDWSAASLHKDADKAASFYAEDGEVLPSNAPKTTGRAQVREVWAHMLGTPGLELTFAPVKIQVAKSGDMAYDVGTYQLKLSDEHGGSTTSVGKYVVVWKKQPDKQWKVAADIFNPDK
jgi:uncharacterized protein (TIGR02246 family)